MTRFLCKFQEISLSHFLPDRFVDILFDIIFNLFAEGSFCSEKTSDPVNTPCEPPQTGERNGRFWGEIVTVCSWSLGDK